MTDIYRIMRELKIYIDSANEKENHQKARHDSKTKKGYMITPIAEQFSDSVVISVEATNLSAIWLCEAASRLQGIIVRRGFLSRGAITNGEIWHKGSTIFGPAFIEAVELEKKTVFPRIEISDNILDWFLSSENENDYQIAKVRESQLVAIDSDSTKRVDPFSEIKAYAGSAHIPERIKNLIESWFNTIESGLSHPDLRTKAKYEWMACEFDKLIEGKNRAILPFKGYPSLTRRIISFQPPPINV